MSGRGASLLLLAACLAMCNVAFAQLPATHRCWDISFPQREETPTRNILLMEQPYIMAESDSGLMLVALAKEYLGTPYHYGGKTPKGFDCAGFARFLYNKFGYTLAPYSGGQYRQGRKVESTRDLVAGDLVFFGARGNTKSVGHTGIAIQTDTATGVFIFIHAATHGGVIISRSSEPYYKIRYLGARRVFQ